MFNDFFQYPRIHYSPTSLTIRFTVHVYSLNKARIHTNLSITQAKQIKHTVTYACLSARFEHEASLERTGRTIPPIELNT